ncbi:hypothetical protein [Maricaulis sp.]|uniref:hypothetical protein n=1 Tax=Maricaulis sp. TaxID=1486257 RepID=UPI00262BE53F|nr:hypothetical protein [Maricaulis sp.]
MTIQKTITATVLTLGIATPAMAQGPGDILFNLRARYENASQDGKLGADAATLRTQLGWRSPEWNGFTLLGEIENVAALDGDDDYNSGLNGLTQYTGIKDGAFTELNRLQLAYAVSEAVTVTAGRQYVDFDDGRFVGSAGWRQDKNSHDALRIDYASGAFAASYVYHARLNRGPGEDAHWDGDSHLLRAQYAVSDAVRLAGFAYFIDITEPGAQERSNTTWGGRVTGERAFGDWGMDYALLYARQTDSGSAATDFDLGYWAGDVSVSRGGASFSVGYDVIEGDGVTAFSNPLGKNHGVLGWADAFSGGGRQGTVDGVEDFNVMAEYGMHWEAGLLRGLSAGLRRHEFEAERTGADLGSEWDGHITAEFDGGIELSWQVAEYDGPGVAPAPADRTKSWIILSFSR